MRIKRILLLIIVSIFCFMPVVNAKDDIEIKSIKLDDFTGKVVFNSMKKIDVEFNDLGQSAEYKIVLKNNTKKTLHVSDFQVSGSSQNFIKYTIADEDRSKNIEPNSTEEIYLTITAQNEKQAGRNLNNNIELNFRFNGSITNPSTSSNLISIIVLIIIGGITITIVMTKFNNRKGTIATVIVCFILLGTSFVFADDTVTAKVSGKVLYQSQNLLETSGTTVSNGNPNYSNSKDIWKYYDKVKNINVSNELIKLENIKETFDITTDNKQRVTAYLVENGDASVPYDLYIISNGVIYAPEDATALFSFPNVETINGLENIIFDNTVKMTGMFTKNEKLTTLDISNLNTSNVTDTSYMFYRNYKLELDESKFNLEKVQNKTQMFSETNLYKMIEKSVNGKTVRKYTGEGSTEYENDVYYYYGNVADNNVKFAGFCWKMVRTTETGGTKLVYNSIPSTSGQCNSTSGIGNKKYNNNNNSIDDGSYVYPNGSDSVIKKHIDTWYEENMTAYTTKLEDTVWCNDRSLGPIIDVQYFGIKNRESSPSLVCPQANDSLTVASGKLKYPVALLTMDERILTQYSFLSWTMTPVAMAGNEVVVGNGNNTTNNLYISIPNEVLPSVSLKQSTKIISGTGTTSEPYVIE